MWYFTWILGVLLACSFGIINVLWLEYTGALELDENVDADLSSTKDK
jgi:cyd operon protein YbgT